MQCLFPQTITIMKRIYLTAFLGLILSLPTFAQYNRRYNNNRRYTNRSRYERSRNYNTWSDNNTYCGFRLGVALASVHSDDNRLDGGDIVGGLNVGFVAGMQLTNYTPLFLEGGIFYTEKGGKGNYQNAKFTYDLNYIEFPVVIKYKYYLGDDIRIQPFMGAYLACGVGGQIKNYGDRVAEDSFSDGNFRRFDGGLRLGCGVSFQNVYLDMTYDAGLANICHDSFDTSHNGCFSLNLGVDF